MDSVLLTGFAPFAGDDANPSREIAQALDGAVIGGRRVVALELPCAFDEALVVLDRALARTRPVLVVALGLAARRGVISVERIAINVDDAPIPDNAGARPVDRPVVVDGPAAYFSTLPVKAIAAALRDVGLPVEVSQTAGTFVCNHVFYGLRHRLEALRERTGREVPGGFIHVPLMDSQAVRHPEHGTLPLAAMVEAIRLALRVALDGLDGRLAAAPRSSDEGSVG